MWLRKELAIIGSSEEKKNVDAIAIEILTNMNATMTTIMKLSGKEPSDMRVEILE